MKGSSMGGGEFEYEPHKLDIKIKNRSEYIDNSFNDIKLHLDEVSLDYQKQGLGTFEGLKKEILRRLVLEMRGK